MSLHRIVPFIAISNVCPITISRQSLYSHLFAQTRWVRVNRCLPLFYLPSICPLCINAQYSHYVFHKFHRLFRILNVLFIFIFFQIISFITFSVHGNTSEFFCRIISLSIQVSCRKSSSIHIYIGPLISHNSSDVS